MGTLLRTVSRLAAGGRKLYRRTETDLTGFVSAAREPDTGRYHAEMEGWKVAAAENGSVVGLERNGCIYADEAHPLGVFLYEVFSPEDYQRFEDQYVTVRYDWALEEFGKIGMKKAVDRHLSAEPKVTGVWKKDSRLLIQMSMPKEAVERFGAPARLELLMTFSPRSITFDLAWFQKSASRVAEGLWLRFCPPQILTGIHKMGEWFRPEDMVLKGGGGFMP